MQTKTIFDGRLEPRLLTDTERRNAVARGRRMQARTIGGYFSAIRSRFRRNSAR